MALIVAASAGRTDAQESTANSRFAAEVGATLPVVWANGNGAPSVQSGASPVLALRASWQTAANWRAGLMARTSTGSVSLREAGTRWDGGSLTLTDAVGTIAFRSTRPGWSRMACEGGLGVSFLAGPSNVAPFQDAPALKPMLDANVAFELPQHFTTRPVSLVVRGNWLRIGGETADDGVQTAGTVRRVTLTLRVGR